MHVSCIPQVIKLIIIIIIIIISTREVAPSAKAGINGEPQLIAALIFQIYC